MGTSADWRRSGVNMFKRVGLLIATNLAVMLLLGIVLSVLQRYFGVNLGQNSTLLRSEERRVGKECCR